MIDTKGRVVGPGWVHTPSGPKRGFGLPPRAVPFTRKEREMGRHLSQAVPPIGQVGRQRA